MDLNYYFDRKNCRLCSGMRSYRFPDLQKVKVYKCSNTCCKLFGKGIVKNILCFCIHCFSLEEQYNNYLFLEKMNETLNQMFYLKESKNKLYLHNIICTFTHTLNDYIDDKGFLIHKNNKYISSYISILENNNHSKFLTKKTFEQFIQIEESSTFIQKYLHKIKFNMNILKS